MTRRTALIPGVLNYSALTGMTDVDRMRHFHCLTREQQAEAIRRLMESGYTEHTIARATGLAVEQIRRVLSEPSGDHTDVKT